MSESTSYAVRCMRIGKDPWIREFTDWGEASTAFTDACHHGSGEWSECRMNNGPGDELVCDPFVGVIYHETDLGDG